MMEIDMSEELSAYMRNLEDRAARLQKELGRTATLRDQFAMAALTGLVVANYGRKDIDPMDVASWAYGISDAMMEARK
jgi:hypothetical protein